MSTINEVFNDRVQFCDKTGHKYRYIDFLKNHVSCWQIKNFGIGGGACEAKLSMLSLELVDKDILKSLGIWEKLSEDKRRELELYDGLNPVERKVPEMPETSEDLVSTSKMAKMAKTRGRKSRHDYSNLPKRIRCINCGSPEDISSAVLYKKAGLDELGDKTEEVKLQEFLNGYKCVKCDPRHRGRQRNPLFKDIPKEIHCCKCNKEITVVSQMVYDLTGGDVGKIKEYCESYLCRKCNPESGAALKVARANGVHRGRKAKPENEGFPKKVTCVVCKTPVAITPDNIREKAGRLGITVEELLKGYKCRKCGGVLRHKKNKE